MLDDLDRTGLAPDLRLMVLLGHALGPGDGHLAAELVRALRGIDGSRRCLEEGLLQATLFFGFPRVVMAFAVVGEVWPREAAGPSAPGGLDPSAWTSAGRELFATVYGRNDAIVHAMLGDFHPAFRDFVIESAYGRILARPELDLASREIMAVGWLAVLRQEPQAIAHGRAALALGAAKDQVREALWSALRDPLRVDRWLARILKRAP